MNESPDKLKEQAHRQFGVAAIVILGIMLLMMLAGVLYLLLIQVGVLDMPYR